MHGSPWDRSRDARAEGREDFGQADYSDAYGYDPHERVGYRVDRDGPERGPDAQAEPRSWRGRSFDADRDTRRQRERIAADRRIFAIVSERLEHDRRVDTSDVEFRVENGVVFLDGTVRTREGKRRIEHMAEIDGVADIVNGLRVREAETRRGWFG
jgi:osmotically-inducible protein OsmY